jgi:hypothetical protein
MSSSAVKVQESQICPSLSSDRTEEEWFADRSRESKRLLRTSPTTPPPPIGDAFVDRWLR